MLVEIDDFCRIIASLCQQIFHFSTSEQVDDDVISFSAVCLGPKFNMTFESEIWLSNASVAPGIVAVYKLYC